MKSTSTLIVAAMLLLPSIALAQAVRPLPADMAKDLELLGKGVVGKALPAPPMDDLVTWYMGTPKGGTWSYHVVKGEEKHLRDEEITPGPDRSGLKTWNQKLGDE